MKKHLTSLLILVLSAILTGSASEVDDIFFPKLRGWKLEVSPRVYTTDNLWDLINGAAESYISYDFIDLQLADYKKKNGAVSHAEIYRLSSRENAFGIYSAERSLEYNFIPVGFQGYLKVGVLNFLTGRFYIKLYSTDSGKEIQESLKMIAMAISDQMGQDNNWPELLDAFPPEGKISNTESYARENFIGLNFLHSAFAVEYEGDYKLFVIRGKDRDKILDMVRAYLKFTRQDMDPEAETSFTIKDKYNGEIPVIISGSDLAGIISGANSIRARRNLEVLVENL